MQLLGSKISLISKSEIRYEGILFTLNPNESTLALAKVRMFGTENRSTDNPVAPREEVFEFIIFRGQDIKDIRLCEPPTPQPPLPGTLPYDPAIVQHSVPAVGVLGNSGIQQPAGMSGNILRPSFGPIGGMNPYPNLVGGDNGASGAALGQLGNNMIPGLSASLGGLGLSGAAAVAAASELPLSPHGDVPPHPDQLTDASGLGDQDLLSGVGARSSNSTPTAGASGSTSVNQSRKSPDFSQKDLENRASSRGSGSGQTRQNDQRNQRGNSTGNRGQGTRGGRPRGRAGAMGQGSFNRFAGNFANRSKTPLKFEEDYDFESANVKFEELKSKMGKMKIGGDTVLVLSAPPTGEATEEVKVEAEASGDVVAPESTEESTEALVSSDDPKVPDSPSTNCYDKQRSFFDSISCEAVERSKGNMQRTDWRHERKLNAETFGMSFNQRRGGYNNRGGGGGGGRGGYYGGGGGGRGGYYRQHNNNDGGYQQRDGGYQQRDGGYQQRDGGYQQRDGGYQQRDGGYQQRDGGYQQQRGGNNYRGGFRGNRGNRGGSGNFRDGGENNGQPRGGYNPRRNWNQQPQQQQQQQQENRV